MSLYILYSSLDAADEGHLDSLQVMMPVKIELPFEAFP